MKQLFRINISQPNDGKGDNLRDAFDKVNQNFDILENDSNTRIQTIQVDTHLKKFNTYFVNTLITGNSLTVYLPDDDSDVTPEQGDVINIMDVGNSLLVPFTIDPGNKKINRVNAPIVVNTQDDYKSFMYINDLIGWKIING